MKKRSLSLALVLGLGLGVFSSPLAAQSVYKSGRYSRSFGNRYLGGSIYASSSISWYRRGSYERSSAHFYVSGYGRLLARSFSVGRVGVSGYSTDRNGSVSGSGRLYVNLAGKTVYSKSFPTSKSWYLRPVTYKVFPRDPSYRFSVGPVPIRVSGNAGAGAKAGVSVRLLPYKAYVGLSGVGQAWGWGRASARADIWVASLGLSFEGRFADQVLSAGASAGSGGVRGRVTYSIRAISLKLYLKARILWKKWSKTIASYRSRNYTKVLWSR
ncbi:MAG TPA: hypothetical protein ENK02_12355 [Planctomycetes bacterium]|nr:hypothetical protein [Planctomycetota bacterium]